MEKLTDSIDQNYKFFQDKLTYCEDIEFRILNPRNIKGKQIIFMYCENIVDETLLYESLYEKVVKNYPHGNDDVDITVLENVFPTALVFFR
jgi:spore germination protein KA